MKNILGGSLLFAVVSATLFTVSGCSKWNQDPLKDKDGVLQTGKPVIEKPVEKPPAISNGIIVTVPIEIVPFKELEEGLFKITVNNLRESEFTSATFIQNIVEFPGAIFNEKTGEFKWTPAAGLLSKNEILKYMTLKIAVVSTPLSAGKESLLNEAEVRIQLNRHFNKPRILSVQGLPEIIREGESAGFKIEIEDIDADPLDPSTWANVLPAASPWKKTITPFVSLKSYNHISGFNYEAVYSLDLRQSELTDSVDEYFFEMNLLSRFKEKSDLFSKGIKIYTSFPDLITTWLNPLDIVLGTQISQQFLIADPKGQLDVSFVGIKNKIQNATLDCHPSTGSYSALVCTFKMDTATVVNPAVMSFTVTTNSRNRNKIDTYERLTDTVLTINLLKK